MKFSIRLIAVVAILFSLNTNVCLAASKKVEKLYTAGREAIDKGKYSRAASKLKRALKQLDKSNAPKDKFYVSILHLLTSSSRQKGDVKAAAGYLNQAIEIMKAGEVKDAELAKLINEEFLAVGQTVKLVDLNTLGEGSSKALINNSAVMTVSKSDSGYEVQISSPGKFDSPTGSTTIDTIRLAKIVTFKINEFDDGQVEASQIKGFQIRSVEKNMWVNLYSCKFAPANSQGKHPSVISAGKMGVVKHVNREIPERVYAPVAGIIASIHSMQKPQTAPLSVNEIPAQSKEEERPQQPIFEESPKVEPISEDEAIERHEQEVNTIDNSMPNTPTTISPIAPPEEERRQDWHEQKQEQVKNRERDSDSERPAKEADENVNEDQDQKKKQKEDKEDESLKEKEKKKEKERKKKDKDDDDDDDDDDDKKDKDDDDDDDDDDKKDKDDDDDDDDDDDKKDKDDDDD